MKEYTNEEIERERAIDRHSQYKVELDLWNLVYGT